MTTAVSFVVNKIETAMSDIVDRIRALMAKAESSQFPGEAESFMAKAQQLIDKYCIDQAQLQHEEHEQIGHQVVKLKDPYSKERSMIWAAVARANRCEIVTHMFQGSSKTNQISLVGRSTDRELVAVIAHSLENQALSQMKRIDLTRSRLSPVVQKRSFLRGFAAQVQTRLASIRQEHKTKAFDWAKPSAGNALELAHGEIQRYLDHEFNLSPQRKRTARVDPAAFGVGRRAGASADVGAKRIGGQRALPKSR